MMMVELAGFPYFEVQFNKKGQVYEPTEAVLVLDFVEHQPATDVFVLAHGWNNDMDEARQLYREMLQQLRDELGNQPAAVRARDFAVLAVLWPSKKFADKDLIASGAASVAAAVSDAAIKEGLDTLREAVDDPESAGKLEEAKGLVARLEESKEAREKFVELVRSALPRSTTDGEDASDEFFSLPPDEVMSRLSRPVLPVGSASTVGTGAAARVGEPVGGAAGLGQFFSGIKSGARNLLNISTYYQMKERAGVVGRDGVNALLLQLRSQVPGVKFHLIGHSFGGRLVTAATMGKDAQPPVEINSLTLLQAAFSHYGFSKNYEGGKNGFFRRVVEERMCSGPMLITHSKHDKAVGLAYPLASLLAGQQAAAIGDKNDRYGGIGRNGAQKTPEASEQTLLAPGGSYGFASNKVFNLDADAVISDHSDIRKKEIAHAVLSAVAST